MNKFTARYCIVPKYGTMSFDCTEMDVAAISLELVSAHTMECDHSYYSN